MYGFFEEFVFPSRLEKELSLLMNNATHIPSVLCFYGYPGTGKTSFAMHLAERISCDFQYLPMNECKIDRDFIGGIRMGQSSLAKMFDAEDEFPLRLVTILDEFHNLSEKSQDFFKTRFDSLSEDEIVIVCLNTTVRQRIESLVTKPILSRMHLINFNVLASEFDELVEQVSLRFPDLKKDEIEEYLPDMRRVTRESRLRLLYKQAESLK